MNHPPTSDLNIHIADAHFAYALRGTLLLLVHGPEAPTDQGWTSYLNFVTQAYEPESIKGLVFTRGGAPNHRQRVNVNETYQQIAADNPRFAILSESVLARMALRALSLVNKNARGFKLNDVQGALTYLDVPANQVEQVRTDLNTICQTLGVKGPAQ